MGEGGRAAGVLAGERASRERFEGKREKGGGGGIPSPNWATCPVFTRLPFSFSFFLFFSGKNSYFTPL